MICRRVHNWRNQSVQNIFWSVHMKSARLMNCFNCHPPHSLMTNNLYPDQVHRSSWSKLLKAMNSLRSLFNGEHRIGHLRNLIQFSTDMLGILKNYTDSINALHTLCQPLIDLLKILSWISNNYDPHQAQQNGRAKNLAKIRLVNAEPLPISKMENDWMNDLARCWIFLDRRNYFFQRGAVVLKF